MMRTAISPRLAMSSLSNAAVMVRASRRFDDGQRLARIDGFAVLHGKAPQPSCHVGRDFAELLHHLDQADHIAYRKSTRLNSSHLVISYAVFCLKQKNAYY